MEQLEQYPADGDFSKLSDDMLEAVAARWEWFSLPRILLALRHGAQTDTLLQFVTASRLPVPEIPGADAGVLLAVSPDELIDRFLNTSHQRIVAQDGEPAEEICTAPALSDEDDLVSEELAAIFLAQGLRDRALAIYHKLSLLNPEKSVYFAKIIRKIETNN